MTPFAGCAILGLEADSMGMPSEPLCLELLPAVESASLFCTNSKAFPFGSDNRVFIKTNKIASVYGKNGLDEYIRNEIKKGNLVRIKKEAPPVVNPRLQLPSIMLTLPLRKRRQIRLRWPLMRIV